MASGTFLEVDRAELTKRLRKLRDKQVARYEKDKAAYPEAMVAWNAKAATALHKLADRMNGKPIEGLHTDYHGRLETPIKMPSMPQEPSLNTCKVDGYLQAVELAKSSTFRIRTDDPILQSLAPESC